MALLDDVIRPAIVTFYSFKGGVGRSMAAANVGYALAQRGYAVLLVDCDLEAPGLTQHFPQAGLRSTSLNLRFGTELLEAALIPNGNSLSQDPADQSDPEVTVTPKVTAAPEGTAQSPQATVPADILFLLETLRARIDAFADEIPSDRLVSYPDDFRHELFTSLYDTVLDTSLPILSQFRSYEVPIQSPMHRTFRQHTPDAQNSAEPKMNGILSLLGPHVEQKLDPGYVRRLQGLRLNELSGNESYLLSNLLRQWLQQVRVPRFQADANLPEYTAHALFTPYDYVILDSRTGINAISGLTLNAVCDRYIVFTSLNEQNLQGTRDFLETIGAPLPAAETAQSNGSPSPAPSPAEFDAQVPSSWPHRGHKPYRVVASPVNDEDADLFRERIQKFEELFTFSQLNSVPLKLHYHVKQSLRETLFVKDFPGLELAEDYQVLADELQAMFWGSEREKGGILGPAMKEWENNPSQIHYHRAWGLILEYVHLKPFDAADCLRSLYTDYPKLSAASGPSRKRRVAHGPGSEVVELPLPVFLALEYCFQLAFNAPKSSEGDRIVSSAAILNLEYALFLLNCAVRGIREKRFASDLWRARIERARKIFERARKIIDDLKVSPNSVTKPEESPAAFEKRGALYQTLEGKLTEASSEPEAGTDEAESDEAERGEAE